MNYVPEGYVLSPWWNESPVHPGVYEVEDGKAFACWDGKEFKLPCWLARGWPAERCIPQAYSYVQKVSSYLNERPLRWRGLCRSS